MEFPFHLYRINRIIHADKSVSPWDVTSFPLREKEFSLRMRWHLLSKNHLDPLPGAPYAFEI